jgi:hypothetical protein
MYSCLCPPCIDIDLLKFLSKCPSFLLLHFFGQVEHQEEKKQLDTFVFFLKLGGLIQPFTLNVLLITGFVDAVFRLKKFLFLLSAGFLNFFLHLLRELFGVPLI